MTRHGPPQEKLQDFYQELEGLLRKQLEQQPGLNDVRLKLLELYFEQQRAEDFLKTARTYQRNVPATSREWQKVASMGRMLLPGEGLFSGHRSDIVEFVGTVAPGGAQEPHRVRRFGDDEQYRPLFEELAQRYEPVRRDPRFLVELELALLGLPTRRPTPLQHARQLSEHVRGAQVYIKREDFAGENPHLTVAVTGQALLALRLGRETLVTGTSDGRRGVIAAQVGARLGLKTLVFMDATQAQHQAANLLFMKLMGAEVQLVKADRLRNRDIREAGLEHWAKNPRACCLLTGLDAAPPPYPMMLQEFTAAIGRECRRQLTALGRRMPALLVTRGGQSADALGLFPAFFGDPDTRLVCVDPPKAAETDVRKAPDPFLQLGAMTSRERKVARNILDRLEYPSVAREHAWLRASGRVEYVETPRTAARQAVEDLARLEGVIPAIETAHALAYACEAARALKPDQSVVAVMAEDAGKDAWDIEQLVSGR